jgi:hypothetical protein
MRQKKVIYLIIAAMFACNENGKLLIKEINFSEIDSITLINSMDRNIDLTNNNSFLSDFQKLELVDGIWKFRGRKILIKRSSKIDTIFTDGTIFQYHNRYYKSKNERNILEGLIEKFSESEEIVIGNVPD